MSRISGYRLLASLTVCLLLTVPAVAAGSGSHLVTVKWLEDNLNRPDVLVLDASSTPAFTAKHIAGAVNVDLLTYGVHDVPNVEMEQRFQSWGVSPGKKIVLYDQGGSMMATRILFSLLYYGFPEKNLFVLDGGLSKWQEMGLPVTKETTPPAKGSFKITKVNESIRVRLPEFLAASGDTDHNVLLEALTPNWHFGEMLAFDRAGHIPNAVFLPSSDFYNPDKTFKSPDEIRKMLAYLDIRPEQQIYTHCGGGVAASVPFFALRYLTNYPNVKLYTESEIGWLSDPRGLPYWTYDQPFLMRETAWLQSWGGQRMRMYGASHLSVVDVRPESAFKEGHLPFSLNIPVEVFRNNLADPEKLAEILGPAGVDPAHEAVVVSGGGLTKESALAFLLLEQLGQKNVSIFTDGFEKSAQLGFGLTKDATLVGPRKSPNDVSIPPVAYRANVRKNIVITDSKSTSGVYAKVFIASGKEMPANSPAGKVVHVPYTDLLNADGRPKAAKEIWNILAKAGVPRYAELVCFADDPGDGAANYFILKLMGFPDIKVLAS